MGNIHNAIYILSTVLFIISTVLLTIQESSQLLQLLHTELTDSKQQVENLQSQYQLLQVI